MKEKGNNISSQSGCVGIIKNENTIQNKVVVRKDDDLSNNHANNHKWPSSVNQLGMGLKMEKEIIVLFG